MNRILIFLVAVAFLVSAGLLADQGLNGCAIKNFIGEEPFKILLQFFLVTTLGGTIFFFLNLIKDNESVKRARILDLQKLDAELSDAYRMMKSSRRRFRSRILPNVEQAQRMELTDFRASMEEILAAQLAVEAVEDAVATRRHLISGKNRQLLGIALHYVARYLHDIYEIYEKGYIYHDSKFYIFHYNSRAMIDFIKEPELPKAMSNERKNLKENEYIYELIESFRLIEALRKDLVKKQKILRAKIEDCDYYQYEDKFRYTKIAFSSFRLSSNLIKQIVDAELRSSWSKCEDIVKLERRAITST